MLNGDDLPPLLHGHYPASSLLRGSPPLSGASVLSASRLEPLAPFPLASPARFSRSIQEPGRDSRHLHAGCRLSSLRHPPSLSRRTGHPSVLTSSKQISTLLQRFAYARLSRPCLTGSCPDFSATSGLMSRAPSTPPSPSPTRPSTRCHGRSQAISTPWGPMAALRRCCSPTASSAWCRPRRTPRWCRRERILSLK